MKDYRQLIKELPSKTIVLACAKFNPPTIGHELLIKAVKSLAEQKNASYAIYASDISDAKKNPLIVEKKMQYLNLLFPNTSFSTYSDNINEVVSKLKETYRNVIVVTSVDKVASLKKSLKEATVISAMDTDPDAEDITRNFAVKGLYEEFKKNLPSAIRDIDSRRLMNDLRVGSGVDPVKEEIKLVKDELREQYFRGEIFNVGEQVEADGQQYEIIKRGSNHLLLKESTGKLVSKWIQNVKLVEKKTEKKKLKSFKSTVKHLGQDAGLTPQDFTSKTFDAFSNTTSTPGV
jgi:predicted SpoU family rRNA methylase